MSVYTNGPSPAYVYSEQYIPMTYVNTNNPYYTPTTTTYTPYYQNTVSNVDVNSYVPVYQNDGSTDGLDMPHRAEFGVSSITAPTSTTSTPTTPRASDILTGIVIGVIIVIVACVLFVLL
jgi:hypothetical protein